MKGISRGSVGQRRLAMGLMVAVVAIWGATFVLVKGAIVDTQPLTFNALRFSLAAMLLLILNWRRLRGVSRATMRGGAVAGCLLAAGYELQVAGLARTTAIHSAFITGLIVVFVPLLTIFPGLRRPGSHRPRWPTFMGALTAFVGLSLITQRPGGESASTGSVGLGDLLTVGCALAFAGHMLSLSRLAHLAAAQLATLQIAFCAAAMLLCLPLGGRPTLHVSVRLALALGVTAVLATAGAFVVQTWAQQRLSATSTALIVTLEPVFALLFSTIFLQERLALRSGLGAALILGGILITELLASTSQVPFEPA